MPMYDGVITVAGEDVPVLVVFDGNNIRMSASGTEIGEWRTDECLISHVGDSTYAITAEDETLQFRPNQPTLFAAAVNLGVRTSVSTTPNPAPEPSVERPEAPEPRPMTMVLFYALCIITAGLALWSMISMIVG